MAYTIKILASAAALNGFLVLAQNEAYGQAANTNMPGNQTDRSHMAGLLPGTPIHVALEQTLDSKKLLAGANVTAKTTEEVKQDGKVVLPKGSKVLGHVTRASARSKGDDDSTLALEFDRAEGKGGQQMALEASIQAMAAPTPVPEGSNDLENSRTTTNPVPTNRGNMPGSPSSGAAATVPRTNEGITGSSADNSAATSSEGAGPNRSGLLKPNSRGVFGLSGLSLDESTANSGQGTLIHSAGKTVHLEAGTRLLLVTQGATTAER